MKVKDLIDFLSRYDTELDVVCYSPDDLIDAAENEFLCSGISSLALTESEPSRTAGGLPTIKLRRSDVSRQVVLLGLGGFRWVQNSLTTT